MSQLMVKVVPEPSAMRGASELSSHAWTARTAIELAMTKQPLTFEVGPSSDRKRIAPRLGIDVAPENRPMSKAAGKAMGVLERLGLPKSVLKPEWSPWKWYVARELDGTPVPCAQPLVTWSEGKGYQLNEDVLKWCFPDTPT